jgi:hypothetical protein
MKNFLKYFLITVVSIVFGFFANWATSIYGCNEIYPLETRPPIKEIRFGCEFWAVIDSILGHPDRKYNMFY